MVKPDEPDKVIYSGVGVGKVHGTTQVLQGSHLGDVYGARAGAVERAPRARRTAPLRAGRVTILSILVFALVSAASGAADLTGSWTGTWTKNGDALPVVVTFQRTPNGFSGSFTSDALQVSDIPFRDVRYVPPTIHFVLAGDATTAVFEGKINGNVAEGTFSEGATRGTFRLNRSNATVPPLRTRDVAFDGRGVRLAGTLLLPAGGAPHPAVLFLHGSGPEGRWANRYLAERFARAGFVALITDKRGVGKSTGDWRIAGFDELAADAEAGLRYLEAQPEVDRAKIGIYGHSQGGTLAPMVAVGSGRVAFIIASAAGGLDPAGIEEYSVGNAVGIARLPPADAADARAFVRAIVDVAYRGKPRASLDALCAKLKARSWYFDPPPPDDPYWSFSSRIAAYHPAAWWRRVAVPVLLLFGGRDERVPPRRSSEAIVAALREGGEKDVTLEMFPNADHTFTLPDGRGWPKRLPDYADIVTAWARERTR